MISFFRKIRQGLLTENKTGKYLKYAFGEIVLVVIGILIALQINNWNEGRNLRQAERKYYENIGRQLREDLILLENNIDFNQRYAGQYEYALGQLGANDRSHLDSLGRIAINLLEFSDFHQESNIYAALVSSGEIRLLNNQDIVNGLQRLEETYIYLNRLESAHFDIIKEIYPDLEKIVRFRPVRVEQAEALYDYKFQNHFVIVLDIMTEKDDIYKQAVRGIENILGLIDAELASR